MPHVLCRQTRHWWSAALSRVSLVFLMAPLPQNVAPSSLCRESWDVCLLSPHLG